MVTLHLVVISLPMGAIAFATDEHPFNENVFETSSSNRDTLVYASADKNVPKAKKYYVTLTKNGYKGNRNLFFKSFYANDHTTISQTSTATGTGSGSANYNSGKHKGDFYDLRARADLKPGETAVYANIAGKWDP